MCVCESKHNHTNIRGRTLTANGPGSPLAHPSISKTNEEAPTSSASKKRPYHFQQPTLKDVNIGADLDRNNFETIIHQPTEISVLQKVSKSILLAYI